MAYINPLLIEQDEEMTEDELFFEEEENNGKLCHACGEVHYFRSSCDEYILDEAEED